MPTSSQPASSSPPPARTPRELIERAIALREMLVERQAETERLTWYPQETHDAFLEAGFYRVLQPRALGGYELDPETFFKIVIELSRGCPSTGWCYCLCSAHIMQLAGLFDEAALGAIIGPSGEFRAASYGFAQGALTRAPGGWRITGKWPYASGAPYSTHFIGQTHLPGEAGAPAREMLFVLPRSEWTLCNDWGDVMGLKGSGSHSVESKNGFLPDTHIIEANLVAGRPGIGRRHANPMYAGQMAGFFSCELVAVAVGTAKGALDEYERLITTRKATMTPGALRADLPDYRRYYGQATAKIEAAEKIVLAVARDHVELSRRAATGGLPYTAETDMRNLLASQEAGRLAWDAMQGIIFRTGGSSAARDGQRLQRYFRDLSTYWTHNAAASDDWFFAQYAQIHLGKMPPGGSSFA